jgi:DNA mismatch repair protein MutS2
VITLLARLDAAAEAARAHPVATGRDLALLGWERVTRQVALHCLNPRAAAAVQAQMPYPDRGAIDLRRSLADELQAAAAGDQRPPLVDISAALDCLEATSPRRLEGPDLVLVAQLAEDLDQLRDWLLSRRSLLPTWSESATQVPAFSGLSGELRRCLDRDGRLLDNASPVLARLRRSAREREQQVRQSVSRAMAEASRRGWAAASEVTLRGDRFCLPLNAADRRKVPGIVHDRSQTGQTVFVEPAETVQLANDLAECRLEMGAEESRLLLALNQQVDRAAPALLAAGELLLLVDQVRAARRWSEELAARRPRLEPGAVLRIHQARHPLLAAALQAAPDAVVPLDLALPPQARVLVISGPNAGGKSVALKTVGVLVLLAQCGWDVPAREDTCLPLVRRVFVDLGDEQSIEASLSSFSAHLSHLRRFLAEADRDSLLLCDEIGSGTDPQEGTALAVTVLDTLAERGALVIASTHYGLLKAAVHDHPAMVNAAMDYDEVSLRPRFTLRLGDPGASHAFDIAARVGLDAQLLDRARALVGEERYQLEQLLRDLSHRARDLADQQQQMQDRLGAVQRRETELDARLADLQRDLAAERESVRRRGEDLLRQARRDLEAAIREVRQQDRRPGDRHDTVARARAELTGIASRLPDAPPSGPGPATLKVGDRVRVPHLGLQGRVVEIRGDRTSVLADGLQVTVDRASIAAMDQPAGDQPAGDQPGDSRPRESAVAWTWSQDDEGIPPELDLRGLRTDEAWSRVDKLLDRALPGGLAQVTIIHGMGPGRLRDQMLDHLAGDPRVASFHPAGERRNNFGATVIHLR